MGDQKMSKKIIILTAIIITMGVINTQIWPNNESKKELSKEKERIINEINKNINNISTNKKISNISIEHNIKHNPKDNIIIMETKNETEIAKLLQSIKKEKLKIIKIKIEQDSLVTEVGYIDE